MTNANDEPRIAANLDEQLDHAAEELITGDSDDPPLSEETVVEMLRMSQLSKRSGLWVDSGRSAETTLWQFAMAEVLPTPSPLRLGVETGKRNDGLLESARALPRLFGIAYRMLGSADEADDIVQDVWLRWQSTNRTRGPAPPHTWGQQLLDFVSIWPSPPTILPFKGASLG